MKPTKTISPLLTNPPNAAGGVGLSDRLEAVKRRVLASTHARWQKIDAELQRWPITLPCPFHPKVKRPVDRDKTFAACLGEGEIAVIRHPCPECVCQSKEEAEGRFWTSRGIPGNLVGATLENFDCEGKSDRLEALKACRKFVSAHRGFLILFGPLGTGKSHLASAILKLYGSGRFITHPDLLMNLRATYKVSGTEKFIRSLQRARVLVLDELGVSHGGADEVPLFYQIIHARYSEGLPTILTSNQDLASLNATLGERLVDRIAEDYQAIALTGTSWRRKTAHGV